MIPRSFSKYTLPVLVLVCVGGQALAATWKTTTAVRLGFLREYARDSRSSQAHFESVRSALSYAAGVSEAKLNQCGYHLEVRPQIYDNQDQLKAKEGAQVLESLRSWIIFGPDSSYAFLLAKRGLSGTPIVSPMAGAQAVGKLKAPYFSMYPPIEKLVAAAITAVDRFSYGKTYGTFYDASCPSCKDFSEEFSRQASGKFKRAFMLDGVGTSPNLVPLMTELASKKIDFLVLPNFRQFSGFVLSRVHQKYPKIKYVGADSWGDENVPSLAPFGLPYTLEGLHVRGGTSGVQMRKFYNVSSLHRNFEDAAVHPPYSAFMAVAFVRELATTLCKLKPKNRDEFIEQVHKLPSNHFVSKIGVGVFRLRGSTNEYSYAVAE